MITWAFDRKRSTALVNYSPDSTQFISTYGSSLTAGQPSSSGLGLRGLSVGYGQRNGHRIVDDVWTDPSNENSVESYSLSILNAW